MVAATRSSLILVKIVEGIKDDFPELSKQRLSGLSHAARIFLRQLHALPVVRHGSWGGHSPLPRHAAPSVAVEQDNLRHIGSMLLQRWAVHPTHPLREFSPQTAQELLPECLMYHMAIESFDRL